MAYFSSWAKSLSQSSEVGGRDSVAFLSDSPTLGAECLVEVGSSSLRSFWLFSLPQYSQWHHAHGRASIP